MKEAAAVLGYTEKLWDEDKDPDGLDDLDWSELTLEQQAAASVLGYTQEKWDK